jgi:uncharacterized coiled-coil protein SlyX
MQGPHLRRRGNGDDTDYGRAWENEVETRLSSLEIKNGHIEQELNRLVERLDKVTDLLTSLRADVAQVIGKLSDAPTKQFIYGSILSVIGFAFVVGGAVATAYHFLR